MSDWQTGFAKHDVEMPGSTPNVGLWVSGAIDMTNEERPKFIIEERADNPGASLDKPEILNAAIKDVSSSLDIGATEADWYMLGKDDELYALNVQEEEVVRENPQWLELMRSGDLSIHEQDAARQSFPDVVDTEVTAQPYPIGDMQSVELGAAFEGPAMEGASRDLNQWHLSQEEWLAASMPTDFRPDLSHDLSPEQDTSHGFDL